MRLDGSGCHACILSDGEALPVYKIERSTTSWGGEKVEGYIQSTAGSRFEVDMENSWDRSRSAPQVLAEVSLDGTCMGKSFVCSSSGCFLFRSHISDQIKQACTRAIAAL
jgi:hypothetical protein